jgi:hypothetical protein
MYDADIAIIDGYFYKFGGMLGGDMNTIGHIYELKMDLDFNTLGVSCATNVF